MSASQTGPDTETEARTPRPEARGGAQAFGLAAGVLLFGLACRELIRFAPRTNLKVSTAADVEEFFFEPTDSSPLVVLGLCAWLLWRRRARLAALWGLQGPAALTAGLWAAAVAIFSWSVHSGAPELQAVALVPALLGAGNLLGGPAALRVMALPAVVLLFAVPIPGPLLNEVIWTLQIWTADFTGAVVGLMGFAVFVSGDQIVMSDALFQIIETCSGIRAIETLGMLSILMVDLFERRGWHAAALIALSLPVAFLINGFRCVGLIFNPHADIASIHSLQGIVMLLAGVLLLYFFDGWLARIPRRDERQSALERRARAGGRRAPLGPRVAALVGFATLFLALSWLPVDGTPRGGRPVASRVVPTELAGWSGEASETDWLFLGRAGFNDPIQRRYRRDGSELELFIGQARPDARFRSYFSPKVGFPGGGWRVERERSAELAGRAVTLRVLRKNAQLILVSHWFEASPGLWDETLRAAMALDRVGPVREPLPAAVRLSTPLPSAREGEIERSTALLEAFIEALSPALQGVISPRGPA